MIPSDIKTLNVLHQYLVSIMTYVIVIKNKFDVFHHFCGNNEGLILCRIWAKGYDISSTTYYLWGLDKLIASPLKVLVHFSVK